MLLIRKAPDLPTPKRADGYHERTPPNLLRQTDECWVLKSRGPVGGKAPLRAAQGMHQHRDFGRIGAEMCVQVLNAFPPQPELDAARFGQVGKVYGERALCAVAHAARQCHCPQQAQWLREQHARHSQQQRRRASAQDKSRTFSLKLVFGVCQILIPTS
jgi:hypothetical protein